jgi:hypothetical protein
MRRRTRTGPDAATIYSVPPDARTRLILDLDLAANPIAGNVLDRLGHAQPFSGWMALTRTIELTLEAARQATPVRQARTTDNSAALDPLTSVTPPSISADPSTATRKKTR